MVNSLKDAYERALRGLKQNPKSDGQEAPPVAVQSTKPSAGVPLELESLEAPLTPRQKRMQREEARKNVKVPYGRTLPPAYRHQAPKQTKSAPSPASPSAVAASGRHKAPRVVVVPAAPPPDPPSVKLEVSRRAACRITSRDSSAASLLARVETAGRASQVHAGKTDDEREVVLGLDFGTSCVKAVVGDAALGKAFAVPFCKSAGISGFLLPSRLYQTGRVFSLEAGTQVYRDLKLSLLASPSDPVLQQRVVAFMALVIRRARGWLLTEHAAIYRRTGIAWKLAVGLPTAQHHQSPLSELFERLAHVAWLAAGQPGDVTDISIQALLASELKRDDAPEAAEITVVPEIAAQIYGFVVSNSFDKQAPNLYLMADVGSGTVDSSLFRVKQGKGGRWDFEFYTSVVEPNGVSNLHRHRVNWWDDALTKAGAPQQLVADLEATKLITDQRFVTPESFSDYFSGVEVKLRDSVKSPDDEFFNLRVLAQVQGKTLWRTWKDNLLPQSSLANIPFFMCGGGVRMSYYQQLEARLSSMPGYTWLKAECWVMGVPDDLVADGVAEDDYDRLSVAYGLSRLEVGKIVKALPQPKLAIPPVNIWRDNYVDKDQC